MGGGPPEAKAGQSRARDSQLKNRTFAGQGERQTHRGTQTWLLGQKTGGSIIWRLVMCKSSKTGVIKSCNELPLDRTPDGQKVQKELLPF